ncbi:hypothetical protein EON83_20565 [bacterium]|nr:MAG: hypothetical protein EON83_20565 [bacterium]
MKQYAPLALYLVFSNTVFAAPLRLHNRLVFTRGEKLLHSEMVWTMNAEGGEQKRVWRVPSGYGQFGGFSSDGKSALSFNPYNIYLHDLQTKRIQHVLVWSGGWSPYISRPLFSPDGQQILCEVGNFNQNTSYSEVLRLQVGKSYSVLNGLNAQKLLPVGESVPPKNLWSEPCWSADGKRIVVVGGPSYSLIRSASNQANAQAEIWTMNTDGTAARQITRNPAWDLQPTLSPNGKQIAFVRRVAIDQSDVDEYASNLWIIDSTNGTEKQLTFFPETYYEMLAKNIYAQVSTPLFSPNGAMLAFEQATGQRWGKEQKILRGIYRIGINGKTTKRLSDGDLVQWIP